MRDCDIRERTVREEFVDGEADRSLRGEADRKFANSERLELDEPERVNS